MTASKSTKNYRNKAERQQAREAAQAALDRLGEDVRAVYDSERWESWLRSLAKFHDYSLNNTLLIAMQMPTATQVASFRSWKRDFNRHVMKGRPLRRHPRRRARRGRLPRGVRGRPA